MPLTSFRPRLWQLFCIVLVTGGTMSLHQAAVADPTAADYYNSATPIAAIYSQFTPTELHTGGYSFGQIIGASPGTDYSAIKAANATAMDFNNAAIPVAAVYSIYTPTELHTGGYSFGQIIGASPGTDYSAIKAANATAMDFNNAAIPVAAVYSIYTPTELHTGGYSFGQIIGASPGTDYSAIKAANATAMDFNNAAIPVAAVYSIYTPTELHTGGYSFGQIIGASPGTDYSAIKAANATAMDFNNAAIPVAAVYSIYTPTELHTGGYSFGQIIGASPGTDYSAIKAANATAMDFNNAAIPVAAVYSIYTPTELHNGGYSFGQIIGASPGTDYSAIKAANATAMDFNNAAIPVAAVYSIYTPTELHTGGYSFGQIIGASPGTDYSAIKAAGATTSDFHDASVAAASLAGVFSSLELVGAGFAGVTSIDWSLLGNTDIHSPASVFEQVTATGNVAFEPVTILSLAFDGVGSAVDWTDAFWSSDHAWTILDVAGTTTGFRNVSVAQADWLDSHGHAFSASHPYGSFSLALDPSNGNSMQLVYTVPEPATCVQVILGGGFLLWRWRRRGPRPCDQGRA